MSTSSATPSRTDASAARRLRTTMAAVRLSFTWFGVRRSLSAEQKEQAADSFGAEGAYLSAAKKLIDTSHSAYKAVTAIRGRASQFWRSLSLPYPEPGIRLIRQDDIALFDVQLTTMQAELAEAVESLNEHFDELKSAARERLGRLFNRADYPESLIGLFRIEHDYPSVEPPQYLRELSPNCSAKNRLGWRLALKKRCVWPKKRSLASSANWSAISPNGSAAATTASRKSFVTRRSRTWASSFNASGS